jgi:hypothetical protein
LVAGITPPATRDLMVGKFLNVYEGEAAPAAEPVKEAV